MTPPAPADRVTVLEGKVDTLSDRVDTLASEMRTGFQALEYQIGASEEETRRQMRILHEEVLDRIARLGEGR